MLFPIYLLNHINTRHSYIFHVDFSPMLAKLLTAPMGAKNADFQTADFTGILVSNNALRERDLGKKEALGQDANSFGLGSLKPGLANHEHEGTPIFVRFLACRLRFFMILQQNTVIIGLLTFSAIAQKDWRSSQSSCFQHTLIIYEVLNHQETGGQK